MTEKKSSVVDFTKAVKPDSKSSNPESTEPDRAEVNLVSAGELKPTPISWLWDGWLARGKTQILAGVAGTGKTTIAMNLAATASRGGRWPDGTSAKKGNVLIWSGEDDPTDTLLPRLLIAGADPKNVWFVDGITGADGKRPFDPAKDVKILSAKMAALGEVSLLIVDPIVSAITGDGHKNNDVRRGLQPLVDLAATHNCALLGITHFSKGGAGNDPLDRVTGSLAFGAVARVVMVTAKTQKEDESHRVLMRAKSNIGSDSGGFKYEIEQGRLSDHPDIFSTYSKWCGFIEGSAREVLGEAEAEQDEEKISALEDAKDFLSELLKDGAVPKKQIEDDSKGAGYSWATVRRAKDSLKVVSGKIGKAFWVWALSKEDIQKFEDAQRCSNPPGQNDEHLEHLHEEPHEQGVSGCFEDAHVFLDEHLHSNPLSMRVSDDLEAEGAQGAQVPGGGDIKEVII